MVKLRVAARVIPEDAYLAQLRTGESGHVEGEKKFAIIVREPEEWYIGTLALEIQDNYKKRYKHDLGKIKYLKAEDDCDLDPEDLVADQLVDEGKAARDGTDQAVTVKIIQEQGRAVRAGSVVPDLTPVHYQRPLQRPSVPLFSDVPTTLGKRDSAKRGSQVNGDHPKRVRLNGITEENEEGDTVVNSIEGNDALRSPELVIQDSQCVQKSPNRHQTAQGQVSTSSPEANRPQQEPVSAPTQNPPPQKKKRGRPPKNPLPADGNAADNSVKTPRTSKIANTAAKTKGPSTESPALGRSSSSASAARFQRNSRDPQAEANPDIDDSQMSPRSRQAATRITPRLVGRTEKDVAKGRGSAASETTESDRSAQEAELPRNQQREASEDQDDEGANMDSAKANATKSTKPQLNREVEAKTPRGTYIKFQKQSQNVNGVSKTVDVISEIAGESSDQEPTSTTGGKRKHKKIAKHPSDKAVTSEDADIDENAALSREDSTFDADSPGQQLSQGLQHYYKSVPAGESEASASKNETDANEKPTKERKVTKLDKITKCLTCWRSRGKCDNERPKCSKCAQFDKDCTRYDVTKAEFEEWEAERKAEKAEHKQSRATPASKKTSPSKAAREESTDATPEVSAETTQIRIDEPSNQQSVASSVSSESIENDRLAVPLQQKKERSLSNESQASASMKPTLPPGMTQEQYDALVKSNSGLTEEERKAQKKSLAKKSSALAIRKTPSRGSEAPGFEGSKDLERKATGEAKESSSDKAKSASVSSVSRKTTSSTPARTPSAAPAAEASKSNERQKSSKPTPSKAAEQAKTISTPTTTPANRNNPPSKRPEQKMNKSAGSVPLSRSRNLGELTARLSAQNSAANSPRPSTNLAKNVAKNQSKKASFLDNSDDSESESSSESDEESSSAENSVKASAKPGAAKASATKRPPTNNAAQKATEDSGSDDSEDSSTASESDSDSDDESS